MDKSLFNHRKKETCFRALVELNQILVNNQRMGSMTELNEKEKAVDEVFIAHDKAGDDETADTEETTSKRHRAAHVVITRMQNVLSPTQFNAATKVFEDNVASYLNKTSSPGLPHDERLKIAAEGVRVWKSADW
jgi:hypothetical protein